MLFPFFPPFPGDGFYIWVLACLGLVPLLWSWRYIAYQVYLTRWCPWVQVSWAAVAAPLLLLLVSKPTPAETP